MGTNRALKIVGVVALAASFAQSSAAPLAVDGDFAEWNRGHIVAVDPAGDATGSFDVTALWAQSEGSILHLRFDTGRTLNLQSGPESDGTLVLELSSVRSDAALRINTRERTVTRRDGSDALQDIGWHAVGYWSAPTYASDDFEVRVDLALAGFASDEPIELRLSGSDQLAEPVMIWGRGEIDTSEPVDFTFPEPLSGQLRVASLNTLRNGIVAPDRSAAVLRLLGASDPDVVLLQEEYNTSAADVEAAIEGEFGTDWNVVKVRDNVIASPMALTKIQNFDDSYAAAILTDASDRARLVLSVHPKCCGHIGSEEDKRRIDQSLAMIRTIKLARQRFGDDLPILVAGDWNLVGSRSPLDLLTDPTGPDLRRLDARHAGGVEVYTWYAPDSSFGPGVLDLATVDRATAERSRAFLLDSRTISESSASALGLEPEDSAASDHLLLVIDF